MKIKSFYVRDYRVLHDLALDLDQRLSFTQDGDYRLDLLVGVNGVGKSTLLRLLAELFQRLDSSLPPGFYFRIIYELKTGDPTPGQPSAPLEVKITNLDDDIDRKHLLETWDGQQAPRLYLRVRQDQQTLDESLVDNIDKRYLPGRIVAFTSGSEQEWELVDSFYQEARASLESLPDFSATNLLEGWSEQPGHIEPKSTENERAFSEKRFLLIKNQFQPLLILCGLLADISKRQSDRPEQTPGLAFPLLAPAFAEVKLKQLTGFSLRIRATSTLPGQEGDFLQNLIEAATFVLRQGDERLLVFDLLDFATNPPDQKSTLDHLQELIVNQGGGLATFQRLCSLHYPPPKQQSVLQQLALQQQLTLQQRPTLSEINLFLERNYHIGDENEDEVQDEEEGEDPPLHMLEWFSDGEISFLSRLCLISLLRTEEALVLLDEPEVHFNDYWKRQLVDMLDHSLRNQQSHVLMTTHSSITLSDVDTASIRVLTRTDNGTSFATPPNIRTLGADPSEIITHVFGAKSASGAHGNEYIQRQIQDIYALDKPDDKLEKFRQLLDIVGSSPWLYLIHREMQALEGKGR